ncbi:MAG: hypothetical protein IKB67_02185 [Clostridia bacterium]|nr:hypothetical protein [Clostridia bacterium]
MAKIKIGWAEVDMTPNCKVQLSGQFYERVTDEVESPVTCTAFALECGNEQLVICSCDLVSISDNLMKDVRDIVKSKTDLPTEKIIINAIHTHTSISYKKIKNLVGHITFGSIKKFLPDDIKYEPRVQVSEGMDLNDALNHIVDCVSKAIISAWDNRKDAYYKAGFGRVPVGMCRRVYYDDGTSRLYGETNNANFDCLESGNDSGLELIYTFDENKNISGVIANVACPAQVVEHKNFISSDYWGKVKDYLRAKFGKNFFVLGLCSAAGDQSPRDLIRSVQPSEKQSPSIGGSNVFRHRADPSMYDVEGLRCIGKRISNEIVSVYEQLDGEYFDESLLIHKTFNIHFPLRKVSLEEYHQAMKEINEFVLAHRGQNITFFESSKMYSSSGIAKRYITQQSINRITEEIHVVRFGDIAIVTNPFELFLDYGNQIRARSKAKQTFIIQLACGSAGYLPTEKAEKSGHYSACVSSGFTGHEGGNLLVSETLEKINEIF